MRDASGRVERFDEVVIAAHGDAALALLDDPTPDERRLLGAFCYRCRTRTVLHTDASLDAPAAAGLDQLEPYIGRRDAPQDGCVTYWMNWLQSLKTSQDLFVTLKPTRPIAPEAVIRTEVYEHPLFDAGAIAAQREIWSLQWRAQHLVPAGSYFYATASTRTPCRPAWRSPQEQLGAACAGPWTVPEESGRIHIFGAAGARGGRGMTSPGPLRRRRQPRAGEAAPA